LPQPLSSQKLWQHEAPPHTRTSSPSSTVVDTSHDSCAGHSAGIGVHSEDTMPAAVPDWRSHAPAANAAHKINMSRTDSL